MVYGFIIHSFLHNPNLLNYLALMQQQPTYNLKPLISPQNKYSMEDEEFNEKQFEDEPSSVEVYLSYFYENIDKDGDLVDSLSHSISYLVSKYHRYQIQNILANADIEIMLQNKSTPSTRFTTDDHIDKKSSILTILSDSGPIEGSFYLPPSDIVSEPKIVTWKQQGACIFTLITEVDENRLLANNTLTQLSKFFAEHFKNPNITSQPKELISKPDEIISILQQFIPNGQLLFISNNLAKQLKRELDSTILKS